jgi:hypothetical protein
MRMIPVFKEDPNRSRPRSVDAATPDPMADGGTAEADLASAARQGRGAQATRQAAVQRLQAAGGNRHARRILQRQQIPPSTAAEDDRPFPVEGLEAKATLAGHPADPTTAGAGAGTAAPATGTSPPATGSTATPAPTLPARTANIHFIAQPPTIESVPAAMIAAGHGQRGAIGWTTPQLNINPTSRTRNTIDVDATASFTVEVAEETTGTGRQVVEDHEQGHVNIGKKLAERHGVTNLKPALEALTDFTPASDAAIISAIQGGITRFEAEESPASKAYDRADYPRMKRANKGANTPLSKIIRRTRRVGALADSLQRLRDQANIEAATPDVPREGPSAVDHWVEQVTAQTAAIPDKTLAMLQYNAEFQILVQAAKAAIMALRDALARKAARAGGDAETVTSGDADLSRLNALLETLKRFNWQIPTELPA